MKRLKSIGAGAFILLILLGSPAPGPAAENGGIAAIGNLLDSSKLPRNEQAGVHARAGEAIRSGVPAEDVEIIVSRALQRGMDGGSINRLLDTGIATRKQGLPDRPVLDRIEQGLSKGVPPERIVAASRRLSEKLAAAQPLVDDLIRRGIRPRQSSERERAIEAAARALEKSVPLEDLRGMGMGVRKRNGSLSLFAGASNTAAYFAGSGMSVNTASRLVRDAVDKGYSERDLDGMVKQMSDRMMHGGRPDDAARYMERDGMGMDRDMGGHGMESGGSMENMGGMGGMGGSRR